MAEHKLDLEFLAGQLALVLEGQRPSSRTELAGIKAGMATNIATKAPRLDATSDLPFIDAASRCSSP